MMPVKLFQRMTDEQEAMAKAVVERDVAAYEKAEAAQKALFERWFRKLSPDQRAEWSAVCARLDAWVVREVVNGSTAQIESIAKEISSVSGVPSEHWHCEPGIQMKG